MSMETLTIKQNKKNQIQYTWTDLLQFLQFIKIHVFATVKILMNIMRFASNQNTLIWLFSLKYYNWINKLFRNTCPATSYVNMFHIQVLTTMSSVSSVTEVYATGNRMMTPGMNTRAGSPDVRMCCRLASRVELIWFVCKL